MRTGVVESADAAARMMRYESRPRVVNTALRDEVASATGLDALIHAQRRRWEVGRWKCGRPKPV